MNSLLNSLCLWLAGWLSLSLSLAGWLAVSLSLSLSLKSPLVLAGLFCALACFLKATKEQDQKKRCE